MATNEVYINKTTGEKITSTEWHNLVVRNKAAEICEKYLNKGDKVYIEGRIKTRKWTDDKGVERYSTEIHCTDFTFLTTKSESQQPSSNDGQSSMAPNKNIEEPEQNDNLPF